MRRTLSIILMFALTLNSATYFLYFKYRQNIVRKQIKLKIKTGVPEDELKVIIFNQSNALEFDWIHSREFRYKGNMYDLVYETEDNSGSRVLHCITDHQETVLFANLTKYVKQTTEGHSSHKTAQKLLNQFYGGLFTPPAIQSVVKLYPFENKINSPTIHNISEPFLINISPPPKSI